MSFISDAAYIHIVDTMAGCPPHEYLRRRGTGRDALAHAQEMVRERLRDGYKHADHFDHWTILKRGNDIFSIRLEERDPGTVGVGPQEPILWSKYAKLPVIGSRIAASHGKNGGIA